MSGMGTYDLETGRQLLHVPDRDGAVVGEVDLRLDGEEAVDLALGGELGCELLEVDALGLQAELHLLVLAH